MTFTRNDVEFDDAPENGEKREKPYDLSEIKPIEPVPEEDASGMGTEFGALDTDLLGIQFIPNIAGSPAAAVPANPAAYAFLQKQNEDEDNRKNLKE